MKYSWLGIPRGRNKFSPEQAEKLMHLKGTQKGFDDCPIPYMQPNIDGIRHFCLCDILGNLNPILGKKYQS